MCEIVIYKVIHYNTVITKTGKKHLQVEDWLYDF